MTQSTQPKVVVAIPCFNTEPFIADVVSKARKYVDQVIVIDDGSHDGTAEMARTTSGKEELEIFYVMIDIMEKSGNTFN